MSNGLVAGLLICGLLENPCDAGADETDGTPGRLADPGSPASFAGLDVDDSALWDFFVPVLPAGAPPSCADAHDNSTSFYQRRQAMLDCLENWAPGDGVLFENEVGDHARFGYVPYIAENGLCNSQPAQGSPCAPGPNLAEIHINSFAPVWLDGLYTYGPGVCDPTTPAQPTNWSIHYPGQSPPIDDCGDQGSPGFGMNDTVDRLSAFVLACGALPPTVCDPTSNPPFPDPLGITHVRLAK